jgi:ABC-type transporter Mla maintaining outer membrane lipid asymmetry ATPase subunit MlaF
MSEPIILALEGIVLHQGGRAVLDDLSLELRANEVLVLVGPSGSGKTSVVRAALGLIRPERGIVRYWSLPRNVTWPWSSRIWRSGLT